MKITKKDNEVLKGILLKLTGVGCGVESQVFSDMLNLASNNLEAYFQREKLREENKAEKLIEDITNLIENYRDAD